MPCVLAKSLKMAAQIQFYHQWLDYLRIDVHGCSAKTALKVVTSRLEECYTYGIPFLEVVHGSSDKAAAQGQTSIGEMLLKHFHHERVVKRIPLSHYSSESPSEYRTTATRFKLKANPRPLKRLESVVFKGFVPEHNVTSPYIPPVGWQVMGTSDFQPFRPVKVTLSYVHEALFGCPLSPFNRGGLRVEQETYEEIRNAVVNVTGNDAINVPGCEFALTPDEFHAVKARLMRGFRAVLEIAEVAGCEANFIDFCSQFAYSATGCRCTPKLEAGPRMVFLNEDGDCRDMPSFQCGCEEFVRSMWNRYSSQWQRSVTTKPDDAHGYSFLYSVIGTHCAGRKCGCDVWAACRKNDPDRSNPSLLQWLFSSRK